MAMIVRRAETIMGDTAPLNPAAHQPQETIMADMEDRVVGVQAARVLAFLMVSKNMLGHVAEGTRPL